LLWYDTTMFFSNRLNWRYIYTLVLVSFVFGVVWGILDVRQRLIDGLADPMPVLNVLIKDGVISQDIAESFQIESSSRINIKAYTTNKELETLLQDPNTNFDLVSLDNKMAQKLIAQQALAPLDHKRLENLDFVSADFRFLLPDKENKYLINLFWGINGFVYNKQKITDPISLNDLWGRKLRNKVALLDSSEEILASVVRSFGWKWAQVSIQNLTKFQKKIKGHLSQLSFHSPTETLVANKLWAMQVPSGRAVFLLRESEEWGFFVPKEGATLWTHGVVVLRKSQNLELAHQFVDFLLSPEIAEQNTFFAKQASTNKGVEEQPIDPMLKPSYLRKINLQQIDPIPTDISGDREMSLLWENMLKPHRK
jgi:spermidine/putrescine transport system substrate-binding protein